jgi:hypothetical protein
MSVRNRSLEQLSAASRLAFLALVLAGCGTADSHPPAPSAVDVLDRETQRIEYLTTGAYDLLGAMISPTLTYSHSNGTVDDREAFLADLRDGNVVYRQMDHRDVSVRFLGNDVAILNGISDLVVTLAGEDLEVPLRFTSVFVQRDGEWYFEAWHSARRPS